MKRTVWIQMVLAAMLVILGGVVIAMAETMTIKIEKHDQEEIAVDINGVREVIRVEDLVEGEERTFDAGEHAIVVKRIGDTLEVSHDGDEFGHQIHNIHEMDHSVWVSADEDCEVLLDGDGEGVIHKKIIVERSGEGGEAQVYAYRIGEGDHTAIDIDELRERIEAGDFEGLEEIEVDSAGYCHGFIAAGGEDHHGHHPVVIKSAGEGCGDYVRYRCEETGSELRVKKSDFISESYVDPATGCLMERVEEPEVHVVTIVRKVQEDEE